MSAIKLFFSKLNARHPGLSAEWFHTHALFIQAGIVATFLLAAWFLLRPKVPKSQFSVREADLRAGKKPPIRGVVDPLGKSRITRKSPLELTGIRVDSAPHDLLGVAIDASEAEIQSAYREQIKRYHPDAVGRPDSREWKDAQKIAEALTNARAALLARLRKS